MGGTVAAASDQNTKYDYPRLQRAVEALLGAHDGLRRENEQLRASAKDELRAMAANRFGPDLTAGSPRCLRTAAKA